MGKKGRRKKPTAGGGGNQSRSKDQRGGATTGTAPRPAGAGSVLYGGVRGRPPIEPGRTALVRDLRSRTDLNGTTVTIRRILDSGRIAVEVPVLEGTSLSSVETVAIKPENLEVQWNCPQRGAAVENAKEECPICMETVMELNQTASIFSCCGGKICNQCFVKTQFGNDPDRCPLCRTDTSDTSDAAELKRIMARANRGDANAMYNVGGFYDYGKMGLRQDQAEARRWYEKAALKGEDRAANNLACSHRDGEGGPVNKVEAARWFRYAAELGHVPAMSNLGLALMQGNGVSRDLEEAEQWLDKAAKAGHELAKDHLHTLEFVKSGLGTVSSLGGGVQCVTFSRP